MSATGYLAIGAIVVLVYLLYQRTVQVESMKAAMQGHLATMEDMRAAQKRCK